MPTDEKTDENNEKLPSSTENVESEISQPVMSQGIPPQDTPSKGSVVAEENLNQPQPVENVPLPLPKKKFSKTIVLIAGIFVGILTLMLIVKVLSGRFGGGGGSSDVVWWGITFDEGAVNPLIEDFCRVGR